MPVPSQRAGHKRFLWLGIAAVVIVVVLIASVLYVFPRGKKTPAISNPQSGLEVVYRAVTNGGGTPPSAMMAEAIGRR
jgi:hypothetical protein